jgi:hemerythrin-like domain-containing protein
MNLKRKGHPMKATEVLEREHEVIAQVAETCGTCAEALRKGFKIPFNVLESIVEFLRVYGDQYHEQEEKRLFDMLRDKGVPAGSCPIAALDHEKVKLAVLIDQLSSAAEVYAKSAGMVNSTLIDTLQSLSEFYPDHIWKENYLLLPMADKLFSEADQQILAQALHAIDSSRGEEARRTVEKFNAAIRLCSETSLIWDPAAIA